VSLGHWDGVRAAFCETSEDEYTALWPQTPAAALTQHVPAYFPMNTFSLGSQIGGHVPSEVLREEQRLRDAFNLWQGKYSTAIGQFAFILRVDGSLAANGSVAAGGGNPILSKSGCLQGSVLSAKTIVGIWR